MKFDSLKSVNSVNQSISKLNRKNKDKFFYFSLFLLMLFNKKNNDKVSALNSLYNKVFDFKNYFKKMIAIEKIKTILAHNIKQKFLL